MRRLLIRPGAIGDIIVSLPALEHLKADYTEVWAPSVAASFFAFADRVDSIASTGIDLLGLAGSVPAASLISRLASFDEVVSWYGASRPEFRESLREINPRATFHAALPGDSWAQHATDFFARQVGAPDELIPRLDFVATVRRDSVVIHPFSGSRRKNWPLASFEAVSAALPYRTEWTAGPEEELAGAVRFSDLGELGIWLAGCRLYIGNDSGISHLAAAVGVPVIALFGPSEPVIWAPRGQNVTVVRRQPLEELSVDEVLAVAETVLNGRRFCDQNEPYQ